MSLYKITSVFMDPLVFSFALFPGKDPDYFDYYRDSTLRFVQTMAKTFPGSRFVAHVTDSVPERDTRALVAAASGAMTIKRYAFPKKRGVYWLVSAMRLRTLWEHEGRETVVVADIHDDTRIQVKQIRKMIRELKERDAEVGLTYWIANEPDCVQYAALPMKMKGKHGHTDGGMIVWRPGGLRRLAVTGRIASDWSEPLAVPEGRRAVPDRHAKRDKSIDASNDLVSSRFAAFCASALHDVTEIPRGVDEILFDGYLHTLPGVDWTKEPRLLMRNHVHKMAQAPRFYADGDVASSSDSDDDESDLSDSDESSSEDDSSEQDSHSDGSTTRSDSDDDSSSDDGEYNEEKICAAVIKAYGKPMHLSQTYPKPMFLDCGAGGSSVFYICAESSSKISAAAAARKRKERLEAFRKSRVKPGGKVAGARRGRKPSTAGRSSKSTKVTKAVTSGGSKGVKRKQESPRSQSPKPAAKSVSRGVSKPAVTVASKAVIDKTVKAVIKTVQQPKRPVGRPPKRPRT